MTSSWQVVKLDRGSGVEEGESCPASSRLFISGDRTSSWKVLTLDWGAGAVSGALGFSTPDEMLDVGQDIKDILDAASTIKSISGTSMDTNN
jgi:hypothetical protein